MTEGRDVLRLSLSMVIFRGGHNVPGFSWWVIAMYFSHYSSDSILSPSQILLAHWRDFKKQKQKNHMILPIFLIIKSLRGILGYVGLDRFTPTALYVDGLNHEFQCISIYTITKSWSSGKLKASWMSTWSFFMSETGTDLLISHCTEENKNIKTKNEDLSIYKYIIFYFRDTS